MDFFLALGAACLLVPALVIFTAGTWGAKKDLESGYANVLLSRGTPAQKVAEEAAKAVVRFEWSAAMVSIYVLSSLIAGLITDSFLEGIGFGALGCFSALLVIHSLPAPKE